MAVRTYLLLQSRDPGDPMREHEAECFRTALGAGRGEVGVIDALERVPTREEILASRAVLMGGSGDYSCLDPDPWISRMTDWVRERRVMQDSVFYLVEEIKRTVHVERMQARMPV